MEPEGSIPCSQEPSTGPYPEPYQSTPSHPIFLRSILILFTHLRLSIPSGLFPSGLPTNILYAFLFSPHSCYMPRPYHPSWLDYSNYTWRRVQRMTSHTASYVLFDVLDCLLYVLLRWLQWSSTESKWWREIEESRICKIFFVSWLHWIYLFNRNNEINIIIYDSVRQKMKVKVLCRNPDYYLRETKRDIYKGLYECRLCYKR
jgi:hypothetical protein